MSGSADTREQAADGIGELIDVTSESSLKPFVVPITGYSIHMTSELSLSILLTLVDTDVYLSLCSPLIRIIGDRFPWQVKSAILGTLGIMISKGGAALKPFLPQLQTTFIKCLQDNSR